MLLLFLEAKDKQRKCQGIDLNQQTFNKECQQFLVFNKLETDLVDLLMLQSEHCKDVHLHYSSSSLEGQVCILSAAQLSKCFKANIGQIEIMQWTLISYWLYTTPWSNKNTSFALIVLKNVDCRATKNVQFSLLCCIFVNTQQNLNFPSTYKTILFTRAWTNFENVEKVF